MFFRRNGCGLEVPGQRHTCQKVGEELAAILVLSCVYLQKYIPSYDEMLRSSLYLNLRLLMQGRSLQICTVRSLHCRGSRMKLPESGCFGSQTNSIAFQGQSGLD